MTDLSCPACGESGDSPVGIVSWVCTNPDCNVETYWVYEKDDD